MNAAASGVAGLLIGALLVPVVGKVIAPVRQQFAQLRTARGLKATLT